MIISSTFVFLGLFIIAFILMRLYLPGFEQQDKHSQRARQLAKEMSRVAQQKGLIPFLVMRVFPLLKKFLGIEYLFGPKMINMVKVVGEYASVEEMLAQKLLRSIMFALPAIVLMFMSPVLIIAFPLAALVLLLRDVQDTQKSFKTLQRQITKDLPPLIDKIMMALETGKPFIQVFQEVEQTSGPKLQHLLQRLNANMQNMRPQEALEIFAKETTIPVMLQFSTAVKIGLEQGYENAKGYFDDIKVEISELRMVALEELTKGKPEQAQLYTFLMIIVGLGSVGFVIYHVFGQLGKLL
ncbi:hypothetical protein [Paenibacillus popilliae]|uniref:Uncharacterized protein n=1 Tax=Paenibacillus popilliae ATCC 14706 TaxID=1212764 RepID=M9L9I3_PAEPP|nr:hypothetical protein [Paenibacillus popilliae]GAC42082.1 hypothetical protein PPOP_1439 [Paenibacillus popilliae ATCC 14706]